MATVPELADGVNGCWRVRVSGPQARARRGARCGSLCHATRLTCAVADLLRTCSLIRQWPLAAAVTRPDGHVAGISFPDCELPSQADSHPLARTQAP